MTQKKGIMKKEHAIRKLLGINQQEAAMLFKISRSHWSMFESGQRDLPLAAQQLLADILVYMQTASKEQPQSEVMSEQQLEYLLRDNQYQQRIINKRIATAEKMDQAQSRRKLLDEFMKLKVKSQPLHPYFLPSQRAKKNQPKTVTDLFQNKHRLELLQIEKQLLESRWQELQRKKSAS